MTPEEQLTKIKNMLEAITEHQATFDARTADFRDQREADRQEAEKRGKEIDRRLDRLSALQEQTEIRLQGLIEHVDRVVARMDRIDGGK